VQKRNKESLLQHQGKNPSGFSAGFADCTTQIENLDRVPPGQGFIAKARQPGGSGASPLIRR